MTASRPTVMAALISGAILGLSGCASAPATPLASAAPVVRPAQPSVSVVAAAIGQRLDAMLAANMTRRP